MNKLYVTGIGSRSCPLEVRKTIFEISKELVKNKFILRSGGADGADTYWEDAFDFYQGEKEIYLPWKGFNNNKSLLYKEPSEKTLHIASTVHPVWDKLKDSVKRLHARNVNQVLGEDVNTPSELVIAWTPDGKASGGSATAMNLAKQHNIPVFNIFNKDDEVMLDHYLAWSIFE